MEGLQTNRNSIKLKTNKSMGPPGGQFRPPGGPSLKMTNISNQSVRGKDGLDRIGWMDKMLHTLCIMHYALCIMHYALFIMHYALCIMHHALCILCMCHQTHLTHINLAGLMDNMPKQCIWYNLIHHSSLLIPHFSSLLITCYGTIL